MQLKKFLTLFAVLAFSTGAFAGNSSTNSALFETSAATAAASLEQEEVDPQILKNTQQAIGLGLTIFDAHRDLNSMSENEKEIEKILEIKIPGILNKMQNSTDEIANEWEPVLVNLTDLLLNNQNIYPAQSINKETGVYMALVISVMYAQQKGLLLGRVANILSAELGAMLEE